MKKANFFLICTGIFLASCSSPSSKTPTEISFKSVPNDTAKLMMKKFQGLQPKADTNYKEFPRLIGFDVKTLQTFTAGKDVIGVKFITAAYLDSCPVYLKNTVLLQIVTKKDKKTFAYYDLRKPNKNITEGGGSTVCPLPPDCIADEEK